jgi:hypothetical protein
VGEAELIEVAGVSTMARMFSSTVSLRKTEASCGR